MALIGGVVVLIVVAFGLWYEVESHGSGTAGPREVIKVESGESVGSVLSKLSADHVIGSTLAFRVYDLVHGSPTILPGHYLLHQNQGFSQVHAILDGGPNIAAVTVDPGLTLHEVAERVDDLPGHSSGGICQGGGQRRRCTPCSRRPGRTTSKGCWAPVTTWWHRGRPIPPF